MGLFKDFKRDFAQAVNELIPDSDELGNEYDDEDIVDTLEDDEYDDDDLLGNVSDEDSILEGFSEEELDEEIGVESENKESLIPKADIIEEKITRSIDESYADALSAKVTAASVAELDEEASDEELTEDNYESVLDSIADAFAKTNGDGNEDSIIDEVHNPSEEVVSRSIDDEVVDTLSEEDELKALDALDEVNMEEGLEDALAVEPTKASDVDLAKDALDKYEKEEPTYDDDFDDLEEDEIEATLEASRNDSIDSILTDDTTYITKGTTIKGDIESDGGIDVIGTVIGNVTCAGKLILGGSIKGNVNVGDLYSNAAKVEGTINATGSVKIGVGSVAVGNVFATSAIIAGAVNGDIDVKGPVIVDSTAVIMGNIKSRSVQINNGAVIEGFCSQCYSEIDVKSFFE